MRRPRATLRILRQPHIAPGCIRFEADCKFATSGITSVPGPLVLPDEHVILAVAYLHEDQCGRCDVGDILARGDPQLRQTIDEEWRKLLGATLSRGRRN